MVSELWVYRMCKGLKIKVLSSVELRVSEKRGR